jgi:hypothetical protein
MIGIDSCVWVDYFNGIDTPQTAVLDELLGVESLASATRSNRGLARISPGRRFPNR